MDDVARQFLTKLLETPAPSGYEQPVQDVVREYLGPFADKIATDVHGNVVAAKNSDAEPRVMLAGCPMAVPNWKLPYIVESSGAVIVGEESCIGTRNTRDLVEEGHESMDAMLEAIADRQLETHCACFTPNDERIEDIRTLAREWAVDGVVHYNLQFCHTFANEAVKVEKVLAEQNTPLLRIETDYSDEDMGQLRTRVDAFLEMIRR